MTTRSRGQEVKTPPFHGGNRGSIPLGITILRQAVWLVAFYLVFSGTLKNFETVYTDWDNDKLIGLICAMDDGIMTAYIHYLLVNPDYQNMGIGK